MTGQHEDPDFVVDPSGTARDVRYYRYGSSQVPPSRPPANGSGGYSEPPPPRQPKRTIYWIPIPIGLIIFLLVSLVRCLSPAEENVHTIDSDSAYREYTQGNRYLFSGDYDKAIFYFNMALRSESDSVDIHNARGLAYRAKGDAGSALKDFDRALELAPDSAVVYNNRAITYQDLRDYDQAIADLTRAIELQPKLGKAYYNRGLAYLALHDYARAIADLDQAIERSSHWTAHPTSEPSESEFGSLLGGFGEQLEAQSYAAPLPSAHYNRGLVYLAREEYEIAIADLRRAIELQPDWSEAEFALTMAQAALALSARVSPALTPERVDVIWPTAADGAFPSEAETAVPFEELPVQIAADVPLPPGRPSTPVWQMTQEACGDQLTDVWVSPGRYLYLVTPEGGESYLVAAEQKSREEAPAKGQCRLPWLNYGSARSTGSSATVYDANEAYRDFCASHSSPPPGSVTTIAREVVTKTIGLGTFRAVQEETSHTYHLPYPKFVNDPQGTIATSEWYACGYGLIRSWTVHAGKYQGRPFEREYGLELVSYTPSTTNESHVRHILVDMQLSDNVEAYRAKIADEETAEALRRWDAGVRVVNIEGLVRRLIDDRWRIVYADTGRPIVGTDVVLTIDESE